jgi:hypothetical protein
MRVFKSIWSGARYLGKAIFELFFPPENPPPEYWD